MRDYSHTVIWEFLWLKEDNVSITYCFFRNIVGKLQQGCIGFEECPSVIFKNCMAFDVYCIQMSFFNGIKCQNVVFQSNIAQEIHCESLGLFTYFSETTLDLKNSALLDGYGNGGAFFFFQTNSYTIEDLNCSNVYLTSQFFFSGPADTIRRLFVQNVTVNDLVFYFGTSNHVLALQDSIFIEINMTLPLGTFISSRNSNTIKNVYIGKSNIQRLIAGYAITFIDCYIDNQAFTRNGLSYAESPAFTIGPITPDVFTTSPRTTIQEVKSRTWIVLVSVFGGVGLIAIVTTILLIRVMNWRKMSDEFERQVLLEEEISKDYG